MFPILYKNNKNWNKHALFSIVPVIFFTASIQMVKFHPLTSTTFVLPVSLRVEITHSRDLSGGLGQSREQNPIQKGETSKFVANVYD